MSTSAIDKQINNYLPQLTVKQKKAVLTVVKTFAEDQEENFPTFYKAKVLNDVREAVEEMKLIKKGKLKARNAEELFHEL